MARRRTGAGMTLKRRLDRLEETVTPPKSEYERRREAEWELYAEPLALTMSEAHVQVLFSFLKGEADNPDGVALYRAFSSVMVGHWTQGRPLALPHVVGEAVLKRQATFGGWDCEVCGYSAPVMASRQDPREDTLVTSNCLLCGGRVGYFAYWLKHEHYPGESCDPLLGSREQQERRRGGVAGKPA